MFVSDNLPFCQRSLACLQFYTIENIIRRNGSESMGNMLKQREGPLILRRNKNGYLSVG